MTNPEQRVAMVLTLMRQLEEVMQAEHALLREMKLDRLRDLQSEKVSLAEQYELELRRLRSDPELLAAASLENRSALEERMRGFRRALSRNAERLRQARELVEGVIRTLNDSLAGPAGQPAYGSASRLPAETGRVVAIAFDRRC